MASSDLPSSHCRLATMDLGSVLHMKEGLGETSYAQNSSYQKGGMEAIKNIIVESAVDVYSLATPQTLTLADLGCSSGPNTLTLVGYIIDAIDERCREASQQPPEFMVFLNDLPTNDFNTLFASVPEFIKRLNIGGGGSSPGPSVFMAGVPGSFYGRLFPKSSLHFISSFYSLHWLSQVPPGLFDSEGKPKNKGSIHIARTSPPSVKIAYFKQFQEDFRLFLTLRSEEVIRGGRIVLIMLGRKLYDRGETRSYLWEELDKAFAILVSQKVIEEDKVDSFNLPVYAPSLMEVEDEVHREGSFTIDHIKLNEWNIKSGDENAKILSMNMRATHDSLIRHHFGGEIIEPLFQTFTRVIRDKFATEEDNEAAQLVLVLTKSN